MRSGVSSSMLWCNWLRLTRSEGSARYQNPVSIRESGASRLNESGVDMDESQRNTASKPILFSNRRGAGRPGGADLGAAGLGGAGLQCVHEKLDDIGALAPEV